MKFPELENSLKNLNMPALSSNVQPLANLPKAAHLQNSNLFDILTNYKLANFVRSAGNETGGVSGRSDEI